MASGITANLLNMSLYELMKVGERNNTLARLKGERVDPDEFFAARRTYYEMAGWDPQTGRPTTAKLAELGVETAAT